MISAIQKFIGTIINLVYFRDPVKQMAAEARSFLGISLAAPYQNQDHGRFEEAT
jgi:hypothetical protein